MAEVRPIDANALYDQMTKGTKKYLVVEPGTKRIIEYGYHADDVLANIDQAPKLDYEPVVHARWEWYEEPVTFICPDPDYGWRCSHCKEDAAEMIRRTFPISNVEFDDDGIPPDFDRCPNCGAKMDGGKGNA